MKELKLEQWCAYFPNKITVEIDVNQCNKCGRLVSLETDDSAKHSIDRIKPILRPLDLTKEIEVNGERFIPASKMITPGFHNKIWFEVEKSKYKYIYFADYELLNSLNFDIFGLIDSGLAIDINNLKL